MSFQTIPGFVPNTITLSEEGSRDNLEAIEHAIILTVAYADVFDFPLTENEIYRYLIGMPASIETVNQALNSGEHTARFLASHEGYYVLREHESIVHTRQWRAAIANKLWSKAYVYGNLIAKLPFVRMVAITGALAMDNTDENADIDFMIVTEPGRLWFCRALVILVVRWAALHSDTVCPNLFITEKVLVYQQRDLYTAHEMVQMVPIAGHKIYQKMMSLNSWISDFLPNAGAYPDAQMDTPAYSLQNQVRIYAEHLLRLPWLDRLERWEMRRKMRKFIRHGPPSNEAKFSADWCRGYFNAHEQRTLLAFTERVRVIEEAWRSLESC